MNLGTMHVRQYKNLRAAVEKAGNTIIKNGLEFVSIGPGISGGVNREYGLDCLDIWSNGGENVTWWAPDCGGNAKEWVYYIKKPLWDSIQNEFKKTEPLNSKKIRLENELAAVEEEIQKEKIEKGEVFELNSAPPGVYEVVTPDRGLLGMKVAVFGNTVYTIRDGKTTKDMKKQNGINQIHWRDIYAQQLLS